MTRRILGLGQPAQIVLLSIYRSTFGHQEPKGARVLLSGRRRDEGLAELKYKALVRQRPGSRLELTTAGRSAVVRVAPLYLPMALFVLLGCLGCGAEFVAVDDPEEPCVFVLDPGEAEAPEDDVVVPVFRDRRADPSGGGRAR
jgi:hypothetical protein